MTHPALIERITRSLAYMLRHQPEKFDLELDPQGFGELEDVVRALNDRLGEPVDPHDIEEAVSSGDRPRYEIRGTKIRALYGHSIDVEPGPPAQAPEFLYVGIDSRDVQRAQQFGLRGGRRRFLHLALTPDDAREAGRRAARDYTILRVFALDAWEEGVNFYDRKTLYLAEHIPTEYLEVLERGADGYEPRSESHPDSGEHERPRSEPRRERSRDGGRSEGGWDRHGRRGERRGGRERSPGGRQERPVHQEQGARERPAGPPPVQRREHAPHPEPRANPVAAAPARANPRPDSDFGLGIFEDEARRSPPARPEPRKPEVSAPPPAAPAASADPFADFGAGL